MERAGVQTCAAADAARTDPVNLGAQGNTFRIVAPGTLQAAALEKHGSPQPGSVFGGHALDFEDEAITFLFSRDIVHDISLLKLAIIKIICTWPLQG